MDIEVLREFVSLSKSLNITQTSRELNIAQSTLSSHIIKLEKDVGVQLIDRESSPYLTLAGREFLEAASDIVDLYDEFKRRYRKGWSRKEEVITIRVPQRREGFAAALLKVIVEFKNVNPGVIIDMQDAQSNVLDDLKKEIIDCGYFGNSVKKPDLDDEFELIPLVDEEFIIWMDKDSPFLEQKRLSPRDLEGYQLPVPVGAGTNNGYLPPMYEELFALYDVKANIKPRYCQSVDDFFLSKIKREDLIILNRGSQMIEAMNEANGKTVCCFKPPIYSTGYLAFRSKDKNLAVECLKEHILSSYKKCFKSEWIS